MSGAMGKAISSIISSLADLVLWFCALAMLVEGTVPRTGFAIVLLFIAVSLGLIGMTYDVWRWFANRRRA